MNALYLILGLFVGAFQMLMTGILSDCVTGNEKKAGKVLLVFAAKVIVYAAAITLIILTVQKLLFVAVGYGAGMTAGCVTIIIKKSVFATRSSKEKNEDETAERR